MHAVLGRSTIRLASYKNVDFVSPHKYKFNIEFIWKPFWLVRSLHDTAAFNISNNHIY